MKNRACLGPLPPPLSRSAFSRKSASAPVPIGGSSMGAQSGQLTPEVGTSLAPEVQPEDLGEGLCDSLLTAQQVAAPVRSVCLVILTLLAICYSLYFCKPVMLPILGAFLLNLLFSPVIGTLNRRGIPNVVGTFIVMGFVVGALGVAMWFGYAPAKTWLKDKDKNLAILETKLLTLKKPFEDFEEMSDQIDALAGKGNGKKKQPSKDTLLDSAVGQTPTLIPELKPAAQAPLVTAPISDEPSEEPAEVVPVELREPSISSRVFSTTGDVMVGVSLMSLLLFYLLAAGDRGLEKLVELMPTFRNKRRIVQLTRAIQKSVSRYLLTTAIINTCLGIVIGFGMYLIGIPNPILWGVMAGLLNFFPFVGALVGAMIVFLVAVISFDTISFATAAPAIYLGVNIIEANFITPVLLGRSVSLHPVWLMIFFVVVSWVWGMGGAIIAVPLLAVIKISCDHIEPLVPIGTFLGR